MDNLKPCPICGSEAHIERYGNSRQSTIYECDSCGLTLETGETWGFDRWNERPIEEKLERRITELETQIAAWEKSFVGHVYVKNEEYQALCQAAKDPSYILNLKKSQVAAFREVNELKESIARLLGVDPPAT